MAAETKPPSKGQFKLDVIYFIMAMFAVLMIRDYWVGQDHSKTIRAVKALIDEAFRTAGGILECNRSILDASARELLARETLGPEDLARLTAKLDREGTTRPALAAVQ